MGSVVVCQTGGPDVRADMVNSIVNRGNELLPRLWAPISWDRVRVTESGSSGSTSAYTRTPRRKTFKMSAPNPRSRNPVFRVSMCPCTPTPRCKTSKLSPIHSRASKSSSVTLRFLNVSGLLWTSPFGHRSPAYGNPLPTSFTNPILSLAPEECRTFDASRSAVRIGRQAIHWM